MSVPPKLTQGCQSVRKSNFIARCMAGGMASLGVLKTGPRAGEAAAFIPIDDHIDVDIRLSAIDASGKIITNRRAPNGNIIGGILNGRADDGSLENGIYYAFLATTGRPDHRGYTKDVDTVMYLSKKFISYGIGSDLERGGRGRFDRPKGLTFIRPFRAYYQVQNNKLAPLLAIGESNTVTMHYQFSEWRPYKSARLGGVLFDSAGRKFYDHSKARIPGPNETLVSPNTSHWLSFFDVIAQTHKMFDLRVNYEGEGEIYSSVSGHRGELIAVGYGKKGTVKLTTMTGSDTAGRGVKFTTVGDISITQCYILSTTSQQPM